MHDSPDNGRSQPNYDPIVRARIEGDRFTRLWFREGERLTTFQKICYGFISVVHMGISVFFIEWYWLSLRSKDLMGMLFSGTLSIIVIALGAMGLQNALKIRKNR